MNNEKKSFLGNIFKLAVLTGALTGTGSVAGLFTAYIYKDHQLQEAKAYSPDQPFSQYIVRPFREASFAEFAKEGAGIALMIMGASVLGGVAIAAAKPKKPEPDGP